MRLIRVLLLRTVEALNVWLRALRNAGVGWCRGAVAAAKCRLRHSCVIALFAIIRPLLTRVHGRGAIPPELHPTLLGGLAATGRGVGGGLGLGGCCGGVLEHALRFGTGVAGVVWGLARGVVGQCGG